MRRGDDEETDGELSSKSTMVNSAVICDLLDGESDSSSESKQMIDEEIRFDLIVRLERRLISPVYFKSKSKSSPFISSPTHLFQCSHLVTMVRPRRLSAPPLVIASPGGTRLHGQPSSDVDSSYEMVTTTAVVALALVFIGLLACYCCMNVKPRRKAAAAVN
ncbi:hypothetical protein QVD17_03278 [Tagetes erecta]|uniref:Uncharacterized protein n=1 Tax=Tagetes erecta TaxID=13708 RepID=A0AAD8LFF7_TARER|nr:hypothetical protein QVD17_03278 [Tagetes erecta]